MWAKENGILESNYTILGADHRDVPFWRAAIRFSSSPAPWRPLCTLANLSIPDVDTYDVVILKQDIGLSRGFPNLPDWVIAGASYSYVRGALYNITRQPTLVIQVLDEHPVDKPDLSKHNSCFPVYYDLFETSLDGGYYSDVDVTAAGPPRQCNLRPSELPGTGEYSQSADPRSCTAVEARFDPSYWKEFNVDLGLQVFAHGGVDPDDIWWPGNAFPIPIAPLCDPCKATGFKTKRRMVGRFANQERFVQRSLTCKTFKYLFGSN